MSEVLQPLAWEDLDVSSHTLLTFLEALWVADVCLSCHLTCLASEG